MQADFLDAHNRHWQDAETLFAKQRWANADHLYGVTAECGLKRLMQAFGMQLNMARDRPHEREDRVHADGIWARYESYRHGHAGATYALGASNPFQDWDIGQRYARQSNFDQARVEGHQAAARQVRELVNQALKDGLL